MYSKVARDRTKLFIKKYGADIATAINGTGLYFEAVIGQKCMESAFGDSALAKGSNNFGGIKNFGNLQGASGKTSSGFAIFPSPLACFQVYVRTLSSPTKKYIGMGVFTATSPEEQIKRMVMAGYCEGMTPAQYVSNCQSAIDATRDICPLGKISNLVASIGSIKQNTT
jgi:flagellum-specific peptidoglycan hydrolase FlgJ